MNHIDDIRDQIRTYRPKVITTGHWRRAAVALLLRQGHPSVEVLLIERARHRDDPWSGHMALPGGGVDEGDEDARAAAERETLEEVGIALAEAEWLGRLDDQQGRARGTRLDLVISAFVYFTPQAVEAQPNHEVATALWVPLGRMLDPERHVLRRFFTHGDTLYPGVRVGESDKHIVWGLTYRFLDMFFRVAGRPLPKASTV